MKISVIVPVYNTEKLLPRCLDSILSQTHTDLEVLVIDDGSADQSGAIADEYAAKDERVRAFHQENKGVSAARNKGIKEAAGEFIAFVDSDDCIRPTMYQRLLETQVANKVDIVTSDIVINQQSMANSLDSERVYSRDEIVNKVLPSFSYTRAIGIMAFTNKLFRSELIKKNKVFFYEGYAFQEDLMFMINIYAHAESMYYLPEAFYEYYPISGGLYTSYRENGGERFIEARKIMLSLIEQYKIPNIDWNNFNNSFLYNISFYIYRTLNYINDKKKRNNLIESVLNNDTVIACCDDLSKTATSFDRRIADAISSGNKVKAVSLIKFVYSGKAGKLQKIIGKIKG